MFERDHRLAVAAGGAARSIATGRITLTVEIEDDEWRGVEITPDHRVELQQESDGPELEVESLRVLD